jgi:pimeloyl-ACP methyl ester carboxylesterase
MGVTLAVVCGLAAMSSDVAAAAMKPCTAGDRQCVLLTVPLDRSGAVPGTVRLRVEIRRAERPERPPLFVFAGFPGESARGAVSDAIDHELREAVRARDLVAIELRGTGRSGELRCPQLERADRSNISEAAAKCAASLGARRGFYTARDSADDVEAVRQALGMEKIALLGGSYGAQVAFTYAQRYPSRVDRLVLDSIAGPQGFDALYRPGLANVSQAIQVLCRKNRCQHASKDPVGDVTELARRLERGPLTGKLIGKAGRPYKVRIGAFPLFQALFLAVHGDRSVMGYVHNAVRGDLKPLLRYRQRLPYGFGGFNSWPGFFSTAAYAASRCEESLLPWSRDASLAERRGQAAAFVQGLPRGSLDPFGPRTALGSDVLELCREWPIASASPEPPKVLPPIPTLIVAGVDDVLAPLSSARAVANLIPGARLLRLRGAGHDIFASGGSGCAPEVLRKFLDGARPKDVCGPEWKSYRGASKPPPLSLAEVDPDPRAGGRPGRALRVVSATIRDGAEIVGGRFFRRIFQLRSSPRRKWGDILLSPTRAGALRRGTYALKPFSWRMTLHGASYVPGVRISGWMVLANKRAKRRGVIRIWGPGAPNGRLVIRRGMISGRLGGRDVFAPLRLGPDLGFIVQPVPKALSSQHAGLATQRLGRWPSRFR